MDAVSGYEMTVQVAKTSNNRAKSNGTWRTFLTNVILLPYRGYYRTVPELPFEKKRLIPALQQLLVLLDSQKINQQFPVLPAWTVLETRVVYHQFLAFSPKHLQERCFWRGFGYKCATIYCRQTVAPDQAFP